MKPLFADTSFFVAYLNRADEHHSTAYEYMARSSGPLLTTTWVLVEFGNYLSGTGNRRLFVPLVRSLRRERRVTIVRAAEPSFEAGLRLYGQRPDQAWSLTDCISFNVMRERRITQALTADHHFAQAGFTILLK